MQRQMQFVNLQLELLDDYRVRLIQIRGELQSLGTSPLCPDHCSILNTVSYIIGLLQQWTNQPVRPSFFAFLDLRFFLILTSTKMHTAYASLFYYQ